MKIVHLIDYYQPQVGYQEYFLAKEHVKSGHQTYVVTSDRYHNFPDYDSVYAPLLGQRIVGEGIKIEQGIKTIRLKSMEIPKTNLIFLLDLYKTIRDLKPDLVLCHGVYSLTSLRIAKIKVKMDFKLIYDTHAASFNTDFNRSFLRKIYHFIYKVIFMGSILKNADSIFAVGQAEQEYVCRDLNLPKEEVPIIRLGVDTKLFRYLVKLRNEIRSTLKIKNGATVIIFTGKITQDKEVHVLVEALEKIPPKKIVLLLIGGGPPDYLNKIKKIAVKTRLIHLPFVENNKLPGFYSASDIAVWPGDSSIAILEAMSCRLPVVLPDYFGTAYLNASPGIIRFRRSNYHHLFQKIKLLAYNQDLISKLGLINRRFVVKNLSWNKIAREILLIPKR
ncbi:hypothetical protein A3D78_01205 [Candidatus Gottesmanbacteria bacterium RIFCSPHIGHO2_02_FULL_39_14]|uniref:Glycosyltransferase subfamily 4-like N-terminal domain-containing protein n=1 Tax=Candidatus Gottesmanbacteria bacterium RIFCSPHIGHO2_02_FULL_39_14 TaxID=1798383 RepID=A0A1F5ZUC5_9BACT|nr:MAG: hypothetical protein A3D78_01205 [Candidatus Gottesmanbacteria bacterium RIFCSPHIGHO2_02_FULL_39_14]